MSRTKYLNRVLDSIKAQTLKPQNILVMFDGHESDYTLVRNKIAELDYEATRVYSTYSNKPADDIFDRRVRIADIHNLAVKLIEDTDWVWCIEDDGILEPDALEKLVDTVERVPNVGMVTGVELGRHGNPYVGAWRVDNIDEIKTIESLSNKYHLEVLEEIDACGLYCALIRADYYKKHKFIGNNGLGPDVNLGLFLRKQGFDNYIDWSLGVTHLGVVEHEEVEVKPSDKSTVVKLTHLYGSTWSSGH